jgi:hypothetical protein
MRVKRKHRLKGRRDGDWQDFPELGRTQYLGATTSATQLRLYEKGKQPEYRHLARPEWVRAEIQIRPVLHAKSRYSTISAHDAWGASSWSQELAGDILEDHVDPHRAGTTWRLSERDKAIAHMCKQYGRHLASMVQDLGTWECLGLTLRDLVEPLGGVSGS